jgi:anti-sigma factor (TIGR02949 family)
MQPADCEETKRQVHEYLHNQLKDGEMDAITAHLANCDSCDKDYSLEVMLNQVVIRSCDEAPAAELGERIMQRLRDVMNHGKELA